MSSAEGICDPAFASVRAAFEANLADGSDLGASLAVYVDGRCVVDLWGGIADERTNRAWEPDTRCVTFSCTKAITATAALLLAERGAVSLAAPVTDWWPEYGSHGKDVTAGEHLLTHQAGLPAFDRPVSAAEAADPAAMAAQLAGQRPEWQPGTAHGYHALTFGWLVAELLRRRSGCSVREFVRAEIGPDVTLGVTAKELAGLARVAKAAGDDIVGPGLPASLTAAYHDPNSVLMRGMSNPAASFNHPVVLAAGWPAAGLVATARGLAGFYARLIAGRIVALETLRDALRERVRGPDRALILDSSFALGFMLPSSSMLVPPAARASAFGHPGASGALGLGDLEHGLAIGYVPNLMRPRLSDRRAYRLVETVYERLQS
jgi:CubicO group peptidase (beta-lactamase class C family)